MLGTTAKNTLLGRNVMKTIVRNSSHGGIPGENLPFSIASRTRFTINFFLYTGTGLAAPFLIMLYQMNKK